MKTLTQVIKDKADLNGLNDHQLSEALSIPEDRLGQILSGAVQCTFDELRKISEYFSCPVIDLYIAAGILTHEDLNQYKRVFNGVESLSETEKDHIQETIYMLEKSEGLEREYF